MLYRQFKRLLDANGGNIANLTAIFNELNTNKANYPIARSFSEALTFETDYSMVADGTSEAYVFTASLAKGIEGATMSISFPTGTATTVDFTDPIFEVRRNDFNNAVDCIAYCSYEFGKVAVSILPNVAV